MYLDNDEVIRLRVWGTDTIYPVPIPPSSGAILGIGNADLEIERDEHGWIIRGAIAVDGIDCHVARLNPGIEIEIEGLTLIAEGVRCIEMRGFLARLIGFRSKELDRALRLIRMAATRRIPLVLRSDGDLVPIAQSIHRRTLGSDRPFIVCDPRRHRTKATVRSPENYETGMEAFAAATGGSLCVRSMRLPDDFRSVLSTLQNPNSHVQLVICDYAAEDNVSTAITIPPLSSRVDELDRIITEYATDSIAEFGADFLSEDLAWVRKYSASSLNDIEKATRRLVAFRASRNQSDAAKLLAMAQVSLSRWIARRKAPEHYGTVAP